MKQGLLKKIDINNSHIIRSLIDKRDLNFYKWLVFDGIKYVLNDMMIISINEFGKIKHLILEKNNELIFFFDIYFVEKYEYEMRAYKVKEKLNSLNKIINGKDLKNLFPVDLYELESGSNFISLKYPLII